MTSKLEDKGEGAKLQGFLTPSSHDNQLGMGARMEPIKVCGDAISM